MTIPVSSISFGEIDAKNEVIEQEKFGSSIFQNSFLVPPGIDPERLITGAKCFIYGQKGCGKTSLLLYVRRLLEEMGASTKTILFKSGITERERQKIAGSAFALVDQSIIKLNDYDYKINWLWYIYRNLLRELKEEQLFKNWDIAISLKKILGVYGEVSTTLLSDLSSKKIKGFAKASLQAGPLTAEIGAEIEAISSDEENTDLEIIEIVEKYISEIVLYPRQRCILLFDELEIFWNRADQRERDLFLIRDLLYSVSRVNRTVGLTNVALGVIASVRSEVLYEVNRVGPEISRDVSDRGVRVHWNVKSDVPNQPILQIVERKIQASEVESDQLPTDDIWTSYFPKNVFGRDFKQYLLDIAMFKPRNIVSLLSLAKEADGGQHQITFEAIQFAQAEFSKRAWTEIEEGLSGEYSAEQVRATKSLLTGFRSTFSLEQFRDRIILLAKSDPRVRRSFQGGDDAPQLMESLYRLGAIGNLYTVTERGQRRRKNHCMFRDYYEALLDKPFEIHESLRKELQLSFVE